MKLGTYSQTTKARTPYSIDYSDSLDSGDYILPVGGLVVITPSPDITVDQISVLPSSSLPNARARMFISKGINLTSYKIRVIATSADGTVFDDEFIIKVKDDN